MIAAFAIDSATGGNDSSSPNSGPLPAISASAPPQAGAQSAACTKVLERLPVTLIGLQPRVVHTEPETPFVVAWGEPAIVLQCGTARPKDLHPGSGTLFVNGGVIPGPLYDVVKGDDGNVWTTVDRAAYISITVPSKYNSGPLPPLSRAIQQALPAVCSTNPADPPATLCAERK